MNILFIGNSHTYYNERQDMFAQMARAGGMSYIYSVRSTAPGVSLSWHCTSKGILLADLPESLVLQLQKIAFEK